MEHNEKCVLYSSHSKNSWKHWARAQFLDPGVLILWQSLAVNVPPTPSRARSCAMGMQPVPRGINAAARAVATPAAESLLEVCGLFLSEKKSLGGPWVPESVWEQAISGLLVFPLLGGVRVPILPVLLALPQPKATPPPRAKGLSSALKN